MGYLTCLVSGTKNWDTWQDSPNKTLLDAFIPGRVSNPPARRLIRGPEGFQ